MKLFHVSNDSGEVEYCYLAETEDEVEEQLEDGESIVAAIQLEPSESISSLPANRRLVRE